MSEGHIPGQTGRKKAAPPTATSEAPDAELEAVDTGTSPVSNQELARNAAGQPSNIRDPLGKSRAYGNRAIAEAASTLPHQEGGQAAAVENGDGVIFNQEEEPEELQPQVPGQGMPDDLGKKLNALGEQQVGPAPAQPVDGAPAPAGSPGAPGGPPAARAPAAPPAGPTAAAPTAAGPGAAVPASGGPGAAPTQAAPASVMGAPVANGAGAAPAPMPAPAAQAQAPMPQAQQMDGGVGLQGGPSPTGEQGAGNGIVAGALQSFRDAATSVRDQIASTIDAQHAAVDTAVAAARASVQAALASMRQQVAANIEATRAGIRERAASARATVQSQTESKKAALTAAANAEKQRLLDASRTRQTDITTHYTTLAQAAREHGAAKAADLRAQAEAQSAAIRNAAASIAQQYGTHDRANDIRVTVGRMAQEAVGRIAQGVAAPSQELANDGNKLADKLTTDGQTYVQHVSRGDAERGATFDTSLQEALAAIDTHSAEILAKIAEAEQQSLGQVDTMEGSLTGQLDQVGTQHMTGLETAATEAHAGVDQGGQKATAALDEQVAQVEAFAGSVGDVSEQQAQGIAQQLQTAGSTLQSKGGEVNSQLAMVGNTASSQLGEATSQITSAIGEVGSNLQGQLSQITQGASDSFGQLEQQYTAALDQQLQTRTNAWRADVDEKITGLDQAKTEATGKLDQTSTQGRAEIDGKHSRAVQEVAKISGKVRPEMAKKAEEIANQSLLDRVISAVSSFFLGVLDAIGDFVKAILIVALVVLAIVAVVAVVLFVIGGAALVAAAASAVAAFLAAAAGVIAVIAAILTVVGVVIAAVAMIQAWNNPNLTTDEKWRATGRGVTDIVLNIVPNFGIGALRKADTIADAARAADQVGDAARAADQIGDAARAADQVGDAARVVDGTGDAARVAGSTDDAARLANQTDEAARLAGRTDDAAAAATRTDDAAAAATRTDDAAAAATRTDDAARLADDATPPGGTPTQFADGATDLTNYRATPEDVAAFMAEFPAVSNRIGQPNRVAEYMAWVADIKARMPNLRGIPDEELMALRGYTSNDYRFLNQALRSGDPAQMAGLEGYIRSASSALGRLPEYRGTTFRGLESLWPGFMTRYAPGAVITEEAFMSTAATTGAAFRGEAVIQVVGTRGRDVSMLSEYAHEAEVLFAPGSRFRVVSRTQDSAGVWQIIMEQVN